MKKGASFILAALIVLSLLPHTSFAAVASRELLCGEWSVTHSNGKSGTVEVPSCLQMTRYDYPSYISMPSIWSNQRHDEESKKEVSEATLSTSFLLPAAWDASDDIKLCFDAIAGSAEITLNDTLLGESDICGAPLSFDVKNIVKSGANTLRVKIARYGDFNYIEDFDSFNLTGIYGEVYLERSAIGDVKIEAYADGTLIVSAQSGNTAALYDGDKFIAKVSLGENKIADITAWNAEKPKLYTLRVEAHDVRGNAVETKEFKVGFRSVRAEGGRLIVNGAPVTLFGVCYSPVSPRGALVLTKEELMRDFTLMRDYNINAVRVINGAASEDLYAAADEVGLYVCVQSAIDIKTDYKLDENAVAARFNAAYAVAQNHASACMVNDEYIAFDLPLPALSKIGVAKEFSDLSQFDEVRGGFYREFADKLLWTKKNMCAFTTASGVGRGVIAPLGGKSALTEGYAALGKSGDEFTIEVFVRPSGEDDVFASADGAYIAQKGGRVEFSLGKTRISASLDNSFYEDTAHIAGVYKDGEMQLFCNGEFKKNARTEYGNAFWSIGAKEHKGGYITKGAIYDKALTLDELIAGESVPALTSDLENITVTEDLSYEYLGYGGDWGDYPSNGAMCASGVFSALREPFGEANALKNLYRPVTAELTGSEGTIKITNRMSFTDASEYTVEWDTDVHGSVTESNTVHLLPIAPSTSSEVTLGANPARPDWGEAYFNVRFMREGKCASHEQFAVASAPPLSQSAAEGALTLDGATVVGDDFTAVFDHHSGRLLRYTYKGALLIEDTSDVQSDDFWDYTQTSDAVFENNGESVRVSSATSYVESGALRRDVYTVYPDGLIELSSAFDDGNFIAALALKIPSEYSSLEYLAAKDGVQGKYQSSFKDEFISRAKPQSVNTRLCAKYVKAGGALLIASDTPFDFTALPYSADALYDAEHEYELKSDGFNYITLSARALSVRIKGTAEGGTEAAVETRGTLCSAITVAGEAIAFAPQKTDYVVYSDTPLSVDASEYAGVTKTVETRGNTAFISLSRGDESHTYRVHFAPREVYLSDAPHKLSGTVTIDKDLNDAQLAFMGNRWAGGEDMYFDKGFATKGNSEITLDISAYKDRTFEAVIGMPLSAFMSPRGWGKGMFNAKCDYIVYLDGKEVYAKRGYSFRDGNIRVSVPVSGGSELKLVTVCESKDFDSCAWADAKLLPKGPLTLYSGIEGDTYTAVVLNTDRDSIAGLLWEEKSGGAAVRFEKIPRGAVRILTLRGVSDADRVRLLAK